MTAEVLTESYGILEQQARVDQIALELAMIDGEQSAAVKPEETSRCEDVNAHQRAVLQAVYGRQHKENIGRLSPPEAIGLLNQAARLYLRGLPEGQKAAALEKLGIIGEYTSGLQLDEVAAKLGKSYPVVNRMKQTAYAAMRRALLLERRTKGSVDTPTSIVEAKIAAAQEKVAASVGEARGGWQERSLCHYLNPDLFDGTMKDEGSKNFAQYVCSLCTVQTECLQSAADQTKLAGMKLVGIRAGLSGYRLKRKINAIK